MTAAQHAAALAAHDHAGTDGAASRSAGSVGLPDSVSRLLPVALSALIVYIYYVYTFRVCTPSEDPATAYTTHNNAVSTSKGSKTLLTRSKKPHQ
ncbi:hypothetical protein BGZ67_010047 [Mortierella alpina]|nr:hypothetical protein BGZ67_010047 [Mortierella alpina]